MTSWVGKTAVVTGASAGIGAAVAVALADAGLQVLGLARRPHLVDELKSRVKGPGSIISRGCDIADPAQVEATFEYVDHQLGGTDILVNNAAVFPQGHITAFGTYELSEEEVVSQIDINFKGLVLCTRRAIASMKKRGVDGHVVQINSIAGHYTPAAHSFNVYPATKHAVTAFCRSLRNELIHYRSTVRVTSISPGHVATELFKNSPMADAKHAEDEKRALTPQDIADAVLYAISTPKHVNISELTLEPVSVARL